MAQLEKNDTIARDQKFRDQIANTQKLYQISRRRFDSAGGQLDEKRSQIGEIYSKIDNSRRIVSF